jgi:hypothetical protein
MDGREYALRQMIYALQAKVDALTEVVQTMAQADKPADGDQQLFVQSTVDKAMNLERTGE